LGQRAGQRATSLSGADDHRVIVLRMLHSMPFHVDL
jgi:ABC-type phosphate/phosphonate transport system ATPase subunit